jgi:hypothetical protein
MDMEEMPMGYENPWAFCILVIISISNQRQLLELKDCIGQPESQLGDEHDKE